MFSFLGLLFTIFIVVAIVQSLRPSRALPGPEPLEIEEPVRDPLPDDMVQEFGDTCVELTHNLVEALAVLEAMAKLFDKEDGASSAEAAAMYADVVGHRDVAAEALTKLLDEHPSHPEEAGWWMSHAIEQLEALADVDDDERITAGIGGASARGAVARAIEIVDSSLFASEEFARRMLDLDLGDWVADHVGKDAKKRFAKSAQRGRARAG
jgi:hypothetical protein